MGQIVQISISDGGVPKLPISVGIVTIDGLEGDRQRNLKVHGGVNRALCLWSQEVIDALRQEGHPIAAGNAGENVTIAGLDWSEMIPGVQFKLGSEVIVEITGYAPPCRHNARWFADQRFSRIDQNKFPGQSRVYTRILQPGTIRPGDSVEPVQDPVLA